MNKWLWNEHKNRKCGKPQNRTGAKFNNFGILHTTENNITSLAVNVAKWQNTQPKVYSGYHYLTDGRGNTVYQCNPLTTRAFHAGKSYNWGGLPGGGNLGIGVSMVAIARYMPYQNDQLHFDRLLNTTATLLVDLEEQFGIPLKKITIKEYRDGERGWLGHQDVAYRIDKLGRKKQRKFDPGANFPWDVLIARAVSIKNQNKIPEHREAKVIAKPDETEHFLSASAKKLQEDGATPNTLNYTARFYREIARRLGISGAQPEQVAEKLMEMIK